MSATDIPLTIGAVNSTVSELVALVDNVSSATSNSQSSVTGTLGAVSTVSNLVGSYTTNTLSKLSSLSGGKINTSEVSSAINTATSVISNTASAASSIYTSVSNIANSHKTDISSSQNETKFDKSVYNKIMATTEVASVAFNYIDKFTNNQYGTFNGDFTFQNFTDLVYDTANLTSAISGWVTLNNKSDDRVWITDVNNVSHIVSASAVALGSIVESAKPLYDKLKENLYSTDESVINDTKSEQSAAATFKEVSSNAINNDSDDTEKYRSGKSQSSLSNAYTSGSSVNGESKVSLYKSSYSFSDIIYPKQIGKSNTRIVNDSVYNNVQAVIYDLTTDSKASLNEVSSAGFDKSSSMLLCYQQPENISYTSSSQYDAVSPRGSQQPFQFYVSNNALELQFNLKWHIDEIRTLVDKENKSYTIQDIADIAEGFTRPWKFGNSIEPKLCKVILPGVQHIGYITNASISYSGDMAGDFSSGSGVLKNNSTPRNPTNYFFSQIDVSFNMIIIKDITLKHKADTRREMIIYEDNASDNKTAKQKNSPEVNDKTNTDTKNNSGTQDKETTAASSSAMSYDLLISKVLSSTTPNASYDPNSSNTPAGYSPLSEPTYASSIDKEGNTLIIDTTNNITYTSKDQQLGFFKSDSGVEIFMANGVPRIVFNNAGVKSYTDDSGSIVPAKPGDDYITNSDGSKSVQVNS